MTLKTPLVAIAFVIGLSTTAFAQGTDGQTQGNVIDEEGPLAGDLNEDGVVDAADYTIWRDSEGVDLNDDGNVNTIDFTLWRNEIEEGGDDTGGSSTTRGG